MKKLLRYLLDIILRSYYKVKFTLSAKKPTARIWIAVKKAQLRKNINFWRARKKGFIAINYENMKKYKTSDTLVILGSGPSINDIDDTEWEKIRRCDSFAFNSFYAHPFTPTYYHMELVSDDPKSREVHKECYLLKPNEFKKIPMILNFKHLSKQSHPLDFDYINNCYVSIPISVSGINSEQDFSEMIGLLTSHDISAMESSLIHHRASLFLAISFAVMMRYEKIVLAGVDMFDMDYFFFDNNNYKDDVSIKLRKAKLEACEKCKEESTQKIHRVADSGIFGALPLDKAIVLYNENYLKPMGIDLSLLSDKSLLYPRIRRLKR